MKIIDIKCPHCNGKLEFDLDRGRTICPYCGSSLYFDDENRTITHVTVVRDEARLKEAENNRRRIEADIKARDRENRNRAASGVAGFIFGVLKIIAILVFGVLVLGLIAGIAGLFLL